MWSGKAGEIAKGSVDDATGRVTAASTGPQVAWRLARGGGVPLHWAVWVALSIAFFVGLADLRRPLASRNFDLLALLSFGVSLIFFERGEVFQSAALAAPPLAFLAARLAWIGLGRRPAAPSRRIPVWILVAATVFLVGFRIAMNITAPTVIDVGYAGVVGADRILRGQAPYGNMPQEGTLRACGKADADGRIRNRIQTNGRCESSNPNGDTYGPVTYETYVPFVAALGWSGRWDRLWAAHAAAIAFDLLVILGLLVAGFRLGGERVAVPLAFGWVAFPFTAYALHMSTNDALMPAILVWGFVAATSPAGRGGLVAAASLAKFAAFLLVPLWLGYRRPGRRGTVRFLLAFAAVSLLSLGILLLEPSFGSALRAFWDRTIVYQLGRHSPFSPWDWGQYHARGIPDLHVVQVVLQVVVLVGAGTAAFLPRRKGPLELAALTGALLAGFELVLTHWFYLYLPWIVPFVLLAILLPAHVSGHRTGDVPLVMESDA